MAAHGLLTGETARSDGVNALFGLLPSGAIMNLTVVVYPQDKLEQHISRLADRAIGDNTDSEYTHRGCREVHNYLKDGHKLDRAQNGHLLLLGPTGAGKSATLNAKIAQLMALHRPRLFIIEADITLVDLATFARQKQ